MHLMDKNQKDSDARASSRKSDDIRYYPSSLGNCIRANVYQMMGYRGAPIEGRSLLVFENGNSFHERMEAMFGDMELLIAPELSLKNPEIFVSGRSDALIHNFMPHEPSGEHIELKDRDGNIVYSGDAADALIVELKSINDKNFNKLTSRSPNKKHMKQLQLYFYQTGLKAGFVYYENKDNQQQKCYYVERDELIIREVIQEIMDTVKFVQEDVLPAPPYTPNDIPCRFCRYREMCHPDTSPFSYEDLFGQEELPF